jgi:voltage-gated potassium channel
MAEEVRGRSHSYELFMASLCVFALATLAVERFVDLTDPMSDVLQLADKAVCLMFLLDFGYSLATAPNRWRYFRTWGWIDLLSSIPTVAALRVGRGARILRIVRVLRGARATRILAGTVIQRRAESAAMSAALATLLLIVFASVAVLHFESEPESTIKTAQDAVWWSVATVTTVGYGDRYPVTWEGRVIAVALMLLGMSLVGVMSGLFASWFMAPTAAQNRGEIEQLQVEIAALRKAIESQARNGPGSRGQLACHSTVAVPFGASHGEG